MRICGLSVAALLSTSLATFQANASARKSGSATSPRRLSADRFALSAIETQPLSFANNSFANNFNGLLTDERWMAFIHAA
jgi:hypothetical protein